MGRRPVIWLAGFFALTLAALGLVAVKTVQTDPFFHYHKPDTGRYFYPLDNQRSQNDGIVRHFDYTGLITGTSMAENFKTTEAEALWGGTFVKVPFSGGSYREINDCLETALRNNPRLRVIIRGLDMSMFMNKKDRMRTDLGEFPTYLYDDDPFNDVRYLFSRDVVFSRVYPMIRNNDVPGFVPGITPFDQYSNWMKVYTFGKDTLFPDGITPREAAGQVHLSAGEADNIRDNIRQNVTTLAERYPDTEFCCFLTPYSAAWWMEKREEGTLERQIEAERTVIREILTCPNIRLFSLNCRFDITTNLNHYKDRIHYGEWINSLLLRCMRENRYLLTPENYEEYLEEELRFYASFDYARLNSQPDYENDGDAAALLAGEI